MGEGRSTDISKISVPSQLHDFLLRFKVSHSEIMAESPSQLVAHQLPGQEAESDLTSFVFEMSQQVQMGMANILKLVNEIDQHSVGIHEEIEKSKDFAMEKKRVLEEEKEHFQKAAYTILDMLSNHG